MATAIERDGLATTNGSISGVVKEGLYSPALPEYIAMQALVADWRKEQETTGSFFVAIGTSPAVILLAPYTTRIQSRVTHSYVVLDPRFGVVSISFDGDSNSVKEGSPEASFKRVLYAAIRSGGVIDGQVTPSTEFGVKIRLTDDVNIYGSSNSNSSHKLRVVEPEQAKEALLASRKLATDIKNGSEFDKERNLVAALRRTSTIPDHY